MRSLPWVREVQKKYADRGLRVIGIHTPEFAHEKDRKAVERKLREFEITYPNLQDNDFAYWRRLNNRYWPAVYIADREGIIRLVHIGETHVGSRDARAVEALIEELLGE